MEKSTIVIEKDYTAELEHFDDTITAEDEALARNARYYYEQAKKLPYVIDQKAAAPNPVTCHAAFVGAHIMRPLRVGCSYKFNFRLEILTN